MGSPENMPKYGGWEIVETLGAGGQSDVFLARTPSRAAQREGSLQQIRTSIDGDKRAGLANAIWSYARPDSHSELGALKVFKIRPAGAPAQDRLKREINILEENRSGLPKLLDSNEAEQWMVTEYFPNRTLAESPGKYKGQAAAALVAFRGLVATVSASLHKDNIVHRDLKPANVFIGNDGCLIPGDFGLVYLPDYSPRPTVADERVGPWECMPQWADLGLRLEDVRPSFDVYMLGKLLWCMVSGKSRLPREYHRWPEFDLATLFQADDQMQLVNTILDKCLVDRPERCLTSATELLVFVDEAVLTIDEGALLLDKSGQLKLRCRACGKGVYQEDAGTVHLDRHDDMGRVLGQVYSRTFVCNVCTHRQFFAPGYPNEAASRHWKPWRQSDS